MALAGQQARGRIQSDPARSRQVNLAPGVKVREIMTRACGALDGFRIGDQLNEIPRHEARGESQMSQQLDQQFGGVAAGA